MSDFELRRALRQLDAPRQPRSDLWPSIATRIDSQTGVQATPHAGARRPRRWLPLAAAAAVLFATVGVVIGLGLRPADPGIAHVATHSLPATPRLDDALSRAHGGDPRLAGAAVVLDAAHAELEQALAQRPDAVFLVGLLNRTNARRLQLERFGVRAG